MENTTIIGLMAGTLTTISFLPQVIKTWKSKSTKDISTGMFVTFCLGILLWVFYGIAINSLPVIITNVVTFMLAFVILVLKLKYR
jgi:MtN3 and saliva related transmembrane protein